VPVQTWPLAYWPDGSLMWTGHAISAAPDMAGPLQLAPGTAAVPATGIKTNLGRLRDRDRYRRLALPHPQARAELFEWLTAAAGRWRATASSSPSSRTARSTPPGRRCARGFRQPGEIRHARAKRPIRAVVKIEGVYKSTTSSRAWLPFTVRFYFYAGSEATAWFHSFVFDGRREQGLHQRSGPRVLRASAGRSAEPARALWGGRGNVGGAGEAVGGPAGGDLRPTRDVFHDQLAGKRIPNFAEFAAREQAYIKDAADWDGSTG